jgi:hypothetical protein
MQWLVPGLHPPGSKKANTPRATCSAPAKDIPLTHDKDNPAPTEPTRQDVSLSLLTIANPAFRFGFGSAGFHRAKWLGLRKKRADSAEGKLEEAIDPAALPPEHAGPQSDSERD